MSPIVDSPAGKIPRFEAEEDEYEASDSDSDDLLSDHESDSE